MWRVLQARRRGRAAARLHVRIVALFSVIAAVPAILVAVVASVTLDRGLDRLFSQQNRIADREFADRRRRLCARARAVRARRHHRDRHRAGARASRCSISRASSSASSSRVQASIRGLPAVMMLDKDLEHRRAGRHPDHPGRLRQAVARGARRRQRYRAAGRDVPRRQLRGRHHQAAQLRRHLSLYRPAARPAGAGAAARRREGASRNIADLEAAGSACRSPSR